MAPSKRCVSKRPAVMLTANWPTRVETVNHKWEQSDRLNVELLLLNAIWLWCMGWQRVSTLPYLPLNSPNGAPQTFQGSLENRMKNHLRLNTEPSKLNGSQNLR